MTVTELKKVLEELEREGKGAYNITIEDEVGFLWDVDEVGEFNETIFLESSSITE